MAPVTRPLRLAAFIVLVFWCVQWTALLLTSSSMRHSPPTPHHNSDRLSLRVAQPTNDTDSKPSNLERCTKLETHTKDSFVDYERLVYCTRLGDSLPWARTVLVVILVVLLYLLSSTADSFFCPALQAIVEKYRIPPDIAGVTFLSFGNGSPDVFSNIAAFSTSTPKIGVTSILGGGLLVTTVIAASVGLASQDQDQLIPRKFIRDVVFYFLAIAYLCFVFFDGTVHLMEALGFLGIYACYVTVILLDSKLAGIYYSIVSPDYEEVEEYDPQKHLRTRSFLSSASYSGSDKSASDSDEPIDVIVPSMITAYRIPSYKSGSDSDQSDSSSLLGVPTLFRKSSAPTPRTKNPQDTGYDSSSSQEAKPFLWRQLTSAQRPASVCVPSLVRRRQTRKRTAWESTQLTAHSNLTAKRWTRGYHELSGIEEFPSVSETGEIEEEEEEEGSVGRQSLVSNSSAHTVLDDVILSSTWDGVVFRWFRCGYTLFERFVWNPLEFSTTFLRRLTIPLIDDETWDKSFAMVCPPCAILLIGMTVFELNPLQDIAFAVAVAVGGGAGTAFVYFTADPLAPPEGGLLAPYLCLAFTMSVIWIMNIASEVLALLKVLGGLFGLSNSVLGVSVLAWGNSIGDLVSNTSIARDGFPTMAFAGCFAGPMFNLLIGIGLALTLAIISNGPVSMGKPSPLVYVGFAFLFTSLLLNLGFAAFDGFQYRPRLCYTLLFFYACFVVTSITIVALDQD